MTGPLMEETLEFLLGCIPEEVFVHYLRMA